jgi:hypothetical protein
VPVSHLGIPFGAFHPPIELYGPEYSGSYRAPKPDSLLIELEAARRTNTRVMLNFSGPSWWFADGGGFNMTKWKQRVDRFRAIDFGSYIADGTVVGHFIMDEPADPSNWNGDLVTPAELDEMARYSKEIWPNLPAIVRAWPVYVKDYQFQYLDAVWAQYLWRLGDIDSFIATNVNLAKAAGLALVAGLNVSNGGSPSSGIPGRNPGKQAMNAEEVRTWGSILLSEPYMCALIVWRYMPDYFARQDIQEAMLDLNHQAENHPKQDCRRQS